MKLYHGSGFKQTILKPGIMHTGEKVEWDLTESNEWLYADADREEAISMAFASAVEKVYSLHRFKTNGNSVELIMEKGSKKPTIDDVLGLKIYLYDIEKDSADKWQLVNNQFNGSKTEWKTKKTITNNLISVEEIDLVDWAKSKRIKISFECKSVSSTW